MIDDNPKPSEADLREKAAEAFKYEKPEASQAPTVKFDITPEDIQGADRARDELANKARERFR